MLKSKGVRREQNCSLLNDRSTVKHGVVTILGYSSMEVIIRKTIRIILGTRKKEK